MCQLSPNLPSAISRKVFAHVLLSPYSTTVESTTSSTTVRLYCLPIYDWRHTRVTSPVRDTPRVWTSSYGGILSPLLQKLQPIACNYCTWNHYLNQGSFRFCYSPGSLEGSSQHRYTRSSLTSYRGHPWEHWCLWPPWQKALKQILHTLRC